MLKLAAAALVLAAVPLLAGQAADPLAVGATEFAGKINSSKLSAKDKASWKSKLDKLMIDTGCTRKGPFYFCDQAGATQKFGAMASLQQMQQDEAKAEAAAVGAKTTSKKKKAP